MICPWLATRELSDLLDQTRLSRVFADLAILHWCTHNDRKGDLWSFLGWFTLTRRQDILDQEVKKLPIVPVSEYLRDRFPWAWARKRHDLYKRWLKREFRVFGRIDILINDTGVGNYKNLVDTSAEEYDELMDVNVRTTFLFTRHAVPIMLAQASGTILMISSMAGVYVEESVYCMTKFAQVGFAQALDRELHPSGIKVGVICPGGVKTEFALGKAISTTTSASAGKPSRWPKNNFLLAKRPFSISMKTDSYENKVALVTGGTSGIGKATALAFSEAGAKVVLTGRREKEWTEVVAEIKQRGGSAAFFRADVARDADVRAAVDFVLATYSRLDVAFNNAALESAGPLDQVTEEHAAVLYLCSDAATFTTGTSLSVDGGLRAR